MPLRYKKLDPNAPDLLTPIEGNAGYDLRANGGFTIFGDTWVTVSTGIAIEIPPGYVGLIRSRSGLAFKYSVISLHGTIDCNYRGEIKLRVKLDSTPDDFFYTAGYTFDHGDKVCQMIIVPYFAEDVELVDDLTNSNRGINGFGSTGK